VISDLFKNILGDVLQDSTYQAALAGLGAGVSAEYNGILFTVAGWSSELAEVADYASKQVRSAVLTPMAFDRQREQLLRSCANFKFKSPLALAGYQRDLALETPRYTNEAIAEAAEKVTLADVVKFQKSLLPESLLEAFLAGNLEEKDVNKLVESVRTAIPSKAALPEDNLPRRQVRVLEPNTRVLRQFVASNPAETNSAVLVYLQYGMDEGDNWLRAALINQLIGEPFFEELRTKQQLGYIVQAGMTEAERVRGFTFAVQSTLLPPPQLEERIDTFLKQYRGTLAKLSPAELETNRKALSKKILDVDKTLNQQVGRFWSEIVNRRYDYDRPWQKSSRVLQVTREDLLDFYDRFIMPGSVTSRRLSTHVFQPKAAPETLVVESLPSKFYPRPPEEPLPTAAIQGKIAA